MKSDPAKRTSGPRPVSSKRAGDGPIDFTKHDPLSSVFAPTDTRQPSPEILELCLNIACPPSAGPSDLALPIIADSPTPLESQVSGREIVQAIPINDPWELSRSAMMDSALSAPLWTQGDPLQLAMTNFDSPGIPLTNVGGPAGATNLYVAAMASSMMSYSFSSSEDPGDSSQSSSRYHSDTIARGIASSSHSGSPGDQPAESAGNLIWFLIAALGIYPFLRGTRS